jgi:hypothetical protein
MFNLWIYHRRPACSARMQHGGSASVQPAGEMDAGHAERTEIRAVVNSGQPAAAENKVLPFRSPLDTGARDGLVRGDRKPRGRSKGRSKA